MNKPSDNATETKILVATKETQGQRKNDFFWATEGEPVVSGHACDGEDIDGGCGCRRSMIGTDSRKATTTVKVAIINKTPKEYAEIIKKYYKDSGWAEAYRTEVKLDEVVNREANELLKIAQMFEVGQVLEIRGDEMHTRAQIGVNGFKSGADTVHEQDKLQIQLNRLYDLNRNVGLILKERNDLMLSIQKEFKISYNTLQAEYMKIEVVRKDRAAAVVDINTKTKKVYEDMQAIMDSLYARWLDESEYEDFKEYEKAIKTRLATVCPEATFVSASKKPFGFIYKLGNATLRITITTKQYKQVGVRA